MTPQDPTARAKVVAAAAKPPSDLDAALDWSVEWRTPLPPREHLLTDSRTGKGAVDKRGTYIFAGAGGVGKSYAAQDLALAVATGAEWYGLRAAAPGNVLHITSEDSFEDVQRRACSLLEHRFPGASFANRVVTIRPRMLAMVRQDRDGNFALTDRFEALLADIRARGKQYDLAILDTAARFAGVSLDKDSAAATAFIDAADALSDAIRGLCLVVAHTNKISRSVDHGRSEASDVRGSTALTDNARGVIQLLPDVDPASKQRTGRVVLEMTKANHVWIWDEIVLERVPDTGVLVPLDEVDRAQWAASRRRQTPEERQVAREAGREARRDREAAAKVEMAARAEAARDARKAARVADDVEVVRDIMASGPKGRLRDLVMARLGCGTGRADRAIAGAGDVDGRTASR